MRRRRTLLASTPLRPQQAPVYKDCKVAPDPSHTHMALSPVTLARKPKRVGALPGAIRVPRAAARPKRASTVS